jgi:hypothetical protein
VARLSLRLTQVGRPVWLQQFTAFGKSGPLDAIAFPRSPQRKIAATAAELISQFGLRASEEATYLAELAAQMRSRKNKVLYELVAREIDASFVEARKRLGLGQSASDATSPGVARGKAHEGGADCAGDDTEPPKLDRLVPRIPSISRTADTPASLVAELNLVDVNPSPRRRLVR